MNYIFRNAVLDYANGGTATALATQLEALRESYPPPAFAALMNLLSSHDQARSLHVFGHHGAASTPAQIALAKRRMLLAVAFQMGYPGAPAVYYGDEVGVTGGDDPYNRATYPWPDEGGQPDLALRAEFKRLIALRHAHPVLRHGGLGAPVHADEHVLVLPRRLGQTWAYTATNNADQARQVSLRLPAEAPRRWVEATSRQPLQATADGLLVVDLPAMAGMVLLGQ
jgi:glycosidase